MALSRELHEAIEDDEDITELLRKGANPEDKNEDGDTSLTHAVKRKNTLAIEALLNDSRTVLATEDKNGFTALHRAAADNFILGIRLLLPAHTDVNCKSSISKKTPLICAVDENSFEAVKELLDDARTDINAYDDIDGWSALISAAWNANEQIVQLLLDKGANVNHKDTNDDWTALHSAVWNKKKEIVQVLLNHPDIIIDTVDAQGRTPLFDARAKGIVAIINLLEHALRKKAEERIEVWHQQTAATRALKSDVLICHDSDHQSDVNIIIESLIKERLTSLSSVLYLHSHDECNIQDLISNTTFIVFILTNAYTASDDFLHIQRLVTTQYERPVICVVLEELGKLDTVIGQRQFNLQGVNLSQGGTEHREFKNLTEYIVTYVKKGVSDSAIAVHFNDQTIELGQTLKLVSSITQSTEAQWMKDGVQLTSDSRLTVKTVGTQHTLKLKYCARRDAGVYECLMFDVIAQTFFSRKTKISVQVNKDVKIRPEELQIVMENGKEFPIGAGAYGTVYKGTYYNLTVAVKKPHIQNQVFNENLNDQVQSEILKEAKKMRTCQHNNVVCCYGVLMDETQNHPSYSLVMDYFDYGSLERCLNKLLLPESIKVLAARDVSLGMNYLHGREIIHRDLKTNNVLLDKTFTAKISDFGKSYYSKTTNTSTISTQGTVTHMSPSELDPGDEYQGPMKEDDVWSYGILLFQLLAENLRDTDLKMKRLPFQENITEKQIIIQVGIKKLCPINDTQIHEKLSTNLLVPLMKKCCCIKPSDRPNFGNIAQQLDDWIEIVFNSRLDWDRFQLQQDAQIVNEGQCLHVDNMESKICAIEEELKKCKFDNGFFDPKHLMKLSTEDIGHDWRTLAIWLGFNAAEIDCFENDHKRLQDRIYHMLSDWVKKNGCLKEQEKFVKFGLACNQVGREDLVATSTMLSEQELMTIAQTLGNKWQHVARFLKFGQAEIDEFHRQTIRDAAHVMLNSWMRKTANWAESACVELHYALCEAGFAEGLKKYGLRLTNTANRFDVQRHIAKIERMQMNCGLIYFPDKLRSCYIFLIHNLPGREMVHILTSQEMTQAEKNRVLLEKHRIEANRCLLKLLAQKEVDVVVVIHHAMKRLCQSDQTYHHVLDQLADKAGISTEDKGDEQP